MNILKIDLVNIYAQISKHSNNKKYMIYNKKNGIHPYILPEIIQQVIVKKQHKIRALIMLIMSIILTLVGYASLLYVLQTLFNVPFEIIVGLDMIGGFLICFFFIEMSR